MDKSSPFALSPDWGMVPLRVIVGLVFLMHGYQKLFVFELTLLAAALTLAAMGPGGFSIDATRAAKSRSAAVL